MLLPHFSQFSKWKQKKNLSGPISRHFCTWNNNQCVISRTDMSFDCWFKLFLHCKVSSVFKIRQSKEARNEHLFCIIIIGSLPLFNPGLWFFFSTALWKTLDAYLFVVYNPSGSLKEVFCLHFRAIKIQLDMGILQLITKKHVRTRLNKTRSNGPN